MKQLVIAGAIVLVIGGVALGVRIHDASVAAERTKLAVEHTRDEARQLIRYCENRAGLAGTLGMATARFELYIATHDRANLQRVMTDLVEQTLGAYEMACTGAKTDIAFVQANVVEPDSWIDVKADEVAGHIAYLARVRAASEALRSAIDTNAADDVLVQRLAALTETAKPPP